MRTHCHRSIVADMPEILLRIQHKKGSDLFNVADLDCCW